MDAGRFQPLKVPCSLTTVVTLITVRRPSNRPSKKTERPLSGVESAYAIAGNKLEELSPQELIDCANGTTNCQNKHCTGGNYLCVGDYLETYGLESETEYPFLSGTGQSGVCHNSESRWHATGVDVVAMTFSSSKSQAAQEETLMTYLLKKGPISISVAADNDAASWQDYVSGVYKGGTAPFLINHAVQLVGYGTDPKEGDYWTVRNSWGCLLHAL